MDEVRLTMSEALLYVALGGAVVGFLLGLVPLILGIVKKKVTTGVIGLIVSTLGGALLGVFISIPAMAIFTWLILREQVVATDAIATPPEPGSQDPEEN